MKNEKKILPEIIIPSSGEKSWAGGAYAIVFVYSKTKGNFVLKGYMREVSEYLKNISHWFAKFTLWQYGECRSIYRFWKKDVYINSPARKPSKYTPKPYKWRFTSYVNKPSTDLYFRRLPERWVKELEKL